MSKERLAATPGGAVPHFDTLIFTGCSHRRRRKHTNIEHLPNVATQVFRFPGVGKSQRSAPDIPPDTTVLGVTTRTDLNEGGGVVAVVERVSAAHGRDIPELQAMTKTTADQGRCRQRANALHSIARARQGLRSACAKVPHPDNIIFRADQRHGIKLADRTYGSAAPEGRCAGVALKVPNSDGLVCARAG
eukprot:CAMPEP_0181516344 /NCGR_PEP_ID=MMETSP1110-20121109/64064_1 /TAXON_ID=174948 /ORGANISM="Symbiodinium sp., Strain CCMP421" /LENGTH=189 /DNA_ID=CAMNT_0023646435 /DNA_START=115 /DNA_END=684 /DNA_ORIENTATION=+